MTPIQSQRYQLRGIAVSKQGGRPENQDDVGWVDTPLGFLAVVCDGMGGGPGGKTASYIAKNVFLTEMVNASPQASRVEALKRAVSKANDALYQKMDEVPSLKGMGSTLVAVLISEQSALVTHLGDSRCYQIRGRRIVFRTKDHSLVGQMVQNKAMTEEQARVSPQSNVIMRGLGNTSNHAPEIEEVAFRKGDRFVLCTDGVWGIMPHEELAARLTSQQDVQSLAGNLSAEVDQRGFATGGHHDNHTMAVVEVNMNSILKDKMDKLTKIIMSIMGVLLLVSLVFNFILSRGGSSGAELEELRTQLGEKSRQITQLESSLQLYSDIKEKGSKELITRVEVLEYEKASLLEYIDSLMDQVDRLETKVNAMSKPTGVMDNGKGTANTGTASETAQKIMNRMTSLKEVSGKDFGKTMGEKRNLRNQILSLVADLDNTTNHKFKPTLDGVARELKDPNSLAMKVMQNQKRIYVTTLPASQKIDQLIGKIKDIKKKL